MATGRELGLGSQKHPPEARAPVEISLQNILSLTKSPWGASRMYYHVKPGHEDDEVPPPGRDLVATGQLPSPPRTRGSTGVLEKPSTSLRGQRVKADCSSTRCAGPTRGRKPSREQGGITAMMRPSKGQHAGSAGLCCVLQLIPRPRTFASPLIKPSRGREYMCKLWNEITPDFLQVIQLCKELLHLSFPLLNKVSLTEYLLANEEA